MTKPAAPPDAPPAAVAPEPPPGDWAIVTGPTKDAAGARILRVRGDTVQAGEVRALVSGAPLAEDAEIVRMKPIGANGVPLYEVESMYHRRSEAAASTKKGPAQVATREYRANWDTVFAPKAGAPN